MDKNKNFKALALFSGGLDSIIAVKLIRELNIEVIPVFFESPFFTSEKVREIAHKLGWELIIIQLKDDYLKIIQKPDYGYGKNINPCIDCHSFMFQKLGEMLPEYDADFLISGEVLAQRPKSQSKIPLATVAKASKFRDLIIRPLSQKLLPDTKPIKKGWLEKSKLLDIEGRSRTRQLQLAKDYNIQHFLSTGGGCSLTDKHFCRRVVDLMENNMWSYNYVKFLTWGRHFRLDENTKLVLGRNERGNKELSKLLNESNITLKAEEFTGPLGILLSFTDIKKENYKLSAGILLRYITEVEGKCVVNFFRNGEIIKSVKVKKMGNDLSSQYLL